MRIYGTHGVLSHALGMHGIHMYCIQPLGHYALVLWPIQYTSLVPVT